MRALATLDLRSLATTRIAVGVLMLADLVERSSRLSLDYTDDGLLPRSWFDEAERDLPLLFVHGLGGSAAFAVLCMLACAVAAMLLLLGWRTRLVSLVSLLLWASLQARNPMIAYHGDTVLRVVLFWGVLLPWGARWSLDARRARRPGPPDTFVGPAAVGFLVQLACIYVFSVAYKSGPAWREDFDAVTLALRMHGYATPVGEALLRYPRVLRLLSVGVLALESLGPLLLFAPLRTEAARLVAAGAFLLFHVALGLTMRLELFTPLMLAVWMAVLPARFWRALGASASAATPLCARSRSIARIAVAATTVLVVLTNVDALAAFRARADIESRLPLFPFASSISMKLGIAQEWSMFAPEPATLTGRLRVTTARGDGTLVDVLRSEVVQTDGPLPDGPDRPLRVRQQELRWSRWMYPLAVERFGLRQCASLDGRLTVEVGLVPTREEDRGAAPEWVELVSVTCPGQRRIDSMMTSPPRKRSPSRTSAPQPTPASTSPCPPALAVRRGGERAGGGSASSAVASATRFCTTTTMNDPSGGGCRNTAVTSPGRAPAPGVIEILTKP
ncbi:MAG: HTTM domain-containing protein [Labilithrix sp.]|nr:HTTM domain-containing protein [Labilithrix sp.]MCW5816787.1 HTTM domain-containing protein [Labilithrix sp.]